MPSEKDQKRKRLKAVEKAYINFLRQLGNEVAVEAQKMVPVITGQLKKSFSIRNVPTGVEISYDAPYAWDVHEGGNTQKLEGPWISSIPKHKRRLASGKIVTVRKHTKTYKEGYKPTSIFGGWITHDFNMERVPNPWLQKAWNIIYNRQDKVTQQVLPKELTLSNKVPGIGGSYG